jgi:hypothetical protein
MLRPQQAGLLCAARQFKRKTSGRRVQIDRFASALAAAIGLRMVAHWRLTRLRE